MRRNIVALFFISAAAVALAGCAGREDLFSGAESETLSGQVFGEGLPDESLLPQMNIRVSEELAANLSGLTDEDGFVRMDEIPSLKSQGVVKMRRLFPDAGKFEARTRAEGLHLWYVLSYDESRSMTKASSGLCIDGVDEIEYCPKMEIIGGRGTAEYASAAPAAAASGSSAPFNDPMLEQQWHYYNNGSASSSVSGCDINVFPVWRNYSTYYQCTDDIIVGVVDEGVDYTHEDLSANMWKNPEKSGNNVYGYNFVTNSYVIDPEEHGTHVAGTVAAVNNNGVGVCGVAGGDSKAKIKGAKIMSCQIFDGDKQGSGAEAIKWSADHGAVISQNSWGYTDINYTPSTLKAAVDYFVKYAGCDSDGKQTGPMKGGLVVFAAGNSAVNYSGNEYEPILNVASVGADYKRAYYTNYGSWCDVAAPGGDAKKGNQVLSTLPGNKYGRMQGTSMACPHVSGLAALVLARYGGTGFTSTSLRSKIEDNVTDISAQNGSYYIGKGLVNAYKAIAGSGGTPPDAPEDLSASSFSNNISFSVRIPSDPDDGMPTSIILYYSTKNFSSTKNIPFGMFYTDGLKTGAKLTGTLTGLEFNTTYYVAALACDLAGNKSALTSRITVETGDNHAPEITASSPLTYSLKPHESAVAEFSINEPDGHFYDIVLDPGSEASTLDTLTRESPKIRIKAQNAPEGSYKAVLTVTDYYGLASSVTVDYTVLANHKPTVVKPLEDRIFTSKSAGTLEFAATDYFNDEDGEELSYSFTFSNQNVANMTYAKGQFLITPMNYGLSEISVTGTDIRGETVTSSFRVMVSDGLKEITLYPNPVRESLNIRVGAQYDAVSVKIISATGATFYKADLGKGSPFDPFKIDMSDAAAGAYTVVTTLDGKEIKSNIVKL